MDNRLLLFLNKFINQINDEANAKDGHTYGEFGVIAVQDFLLGIEEIPHGSQHDVPGCGTNHGKKDEILQVHPG